MEKDNSKDVHTEHCCRKHGCKYGDEACTVEYGAKAQSFPCEYCDADESYQDYLGYGGSEQKPVYVLYRTESHRDRITTFLGVFSSEEKAKEAMARNQKLGVSTYRPAGYPAWEYDIVEAILNEGVA